MSSPSIAILKYIFLIGLHFFTPKIFELKQIKRNGIANKIKNIL